MCYVLGWLIVSYVLETRCFCVMSLRVVIGELRFRN